MESVTGVSHIVTKNCNLRTISYKFKISSISHRVTRWLLKARARWPNSLATLTVETYRIRSNPFAKMKWNVVRHWRRAVGSDYEIWINLRHVCLRVRIIRFIILPLTDVETTQDDCSTACVCVCVCVFLCTDFSSGTTRRVISTVLVASEHCVSSICGNILRFTTRPNYTGWPHPHSRQFLSCYSWLAWHPVSKLNGCLLSYHHICIW